MAIAVRAFVAAGAGRVKVAAGGQSGHLFPVRHCGAAIRVLMDMEPMQAGSEAF